MHVQLRNYEIAHGDLGISQTVASMLVLIRQGATTPIVQQTAQQICASATRGVDAIASGYYQAAAIREWIAQRWVFVDDPEEAELLYAPDTQLALIAENGVMRADCDDCATLAASLCVAAGLKARIVCVGFSDLTEPATSFTHTWTESRPALGALWLELDVTRPMQTIPLDRIGRAASWDV